MCVVVDVDVGVGEGVWVWVCTCECVTPPHTYMLVLLSILQEKMLSNGPNDNQCCVPVGRESLKVNTYVVPTSKKRQDLRWEVRTSMAHKDDVLK